MNTNRARARVLLALMSLACWATQSGCGPDDSSQTPESVAANALASSGNWKLQSMVIEGQSKQLVGEKATISFSASTIAGNTGCNHFSSQYTALPDGSFSQMGGGVTEMGCFNAEQEANFLAVLFCVNQYQLAADTLRMSDGTKNNVLVFVPDHPISLPLAGTRWQLTHFTESDSQTSMASVVLKGHPIWLQIDSEEVRGNSGCRAFQGSVETLAEGQLTFSDLAATGDTTCGSAAAQQEKDFLERLAKVTRYVIRENVLTLTNDDGTLGLQLEGPPADAE